MSTISPQTGSSPTEPIVAKPTIPPLANGDFLTGVEFDRRYEAMPELKKAELIEGVVYMGSPVRTDVHGSPHADMITWAGNYRAATRGVMLADNASVRLDADNRCQPDVLLRIEPKAGGKSRLAEDGYLDGPPEFVAEVTASTASYDLNQKLKVYRRSGVQEYLAHRTEDHAIDWFVLDAGRYGAMQPEADGILKSRVFPGLWLDAAALLAGDLAKVLAILQQGIASPEHAAFVERLAQSK